MSVWLGLVPPEFMFDVCLNAVKFLVVHKSLRYNFHSFSVTLPKFFWLPFK